MKKNVMLFLVLICSLFQLSCTNDSEDDLVEISEEPETELVTYSGNVKAIMEGSCTGCHSSPPTNGAPFSLTTFSQVEVRASGILTAMSRNSGSSGAMPPSGKLAQTTIDIIEQWIEDGKPE